MKTTNNICRHLGGYEAIVSEKKQRYIVAKDRRINIHDLKSLRRIKTIPINNPSEFCMNSEESFLFCTTTENDLYILDTENGELKSEKRIKLESTVDGVEIGEIQKLIYVKDPLLLVVPVGPLEIFLVDFQSGDADCLFEAEASEDSFNIVDFKYDQERQVLAYSYIEYGDEQVSKERVVKRPPRQLESKLFDCVINLEKIAIDSAVLFFDIEQEMFLMKTYKPRFLRKTQTEIVFFDRKKEIKKTYQVLHKLYRMKKFFLIDWKKLS